MRFGSFLVLAFVIVVIAGVAGYMANRHDSASMDAAAGGGGSTSGQSSSESGKAPPLQVAEWVKGGPVKLEQGNVYVLEFWATWCRNCRLSAAKLSALQQEYRDDGLVVVGISAEDAQTVRSYVETTDVEMGFAVGVDDSGQTTEAYMTARGHSGYPLALVIDRKGRIVWEGPALGPVERVVERLMQMRSGDGDSGEEDTDENG